MALSDDVLIEKSKQGDLDAFEQLVRRYENKIYNICYRFMGNHADASDLAQETFIRLYKALPKFRGESGFMTWLYRICGNVCRDELRRQQRRQKVFLDESSNGPVLSASIRSQDLLPEEMLERQELKLMIQSCMNSLSEDHRLILILREIQGLSYEELAEVLDCTLGTVKSRLSRARLALKEIISAEPELLSTGYRHKKKGRV
ncbi:RNA polymerase sigma factor [Desulfolucanica intricata]|uniref:RNA polymerase sigma factor n=1 Tax=Desulfolucanica intricata TaxID=1285191 RepID=UPI000835C4EF|nr:sigma-70 family RNA polymerase sigma factor [Desulfolucanica intricata]